VIATHTFHPLPKPATEFVRRPGTDAAEPAETRGITRDGVRLLVAEPGAVTHTTFRHLGEFLTAGDLLVINNSATMAAALPGWRVVEREWVRIAVHFSTVLDDGTWVVELRPAGRATGYLPDIRSSERINLPEGAALVVVEGYPDPEVVGGRLHRVRLAIEGSVGTDGVAAYLERHGRPIKYSYVEGDWPLSAYQTVFGIVPGSAEMASAARPFSAELVARLVAAGIQIAPITLHAGVTSADAGEPPTPERFVVPATTARLVNETHHAGGRVIAVGTTPTRALETVARPDGIVEPGAGWTDLVLGPDRPSYTVDGLITGWHDAGASHLLLLEAVAGLELVGAAYRAAVPLDYRWHEFGDSALLLPARAADMGL
jgi:S-adenosylmethionine:tRNA ribosyltransferase-isomerase